MLTFWTRMARMESLSEVLVEEVGSLLVRAAGLGAGVAVEVEVEEEAEEEQQRTMKAEEEEGLLKVIVFIRGIETLEAAKQRRCFSINGCCRASIFFLFTLPLLFYA